MRQIDLTLFGILDNCYDIYQCCHCTLHDIEITAIIMLSTLLQCCIVIAMQIKLTAVVAVVKLKQDNDPFLIEFFIHGIIYDLKSSLANV